MKKQKACSECGNNIDISKTYGVSYGHSYNTYWCNDCMNDDY